MWATAGVAQLPPADKASAGDLGDVLYSMLGSPRQRIGERERGPTHKSFLILSSRALHILDPTISLSLEAVQVQ